MCCVLSWFMTSLIFKMNEFRLGIHYTYLKSDLKKTYVWDAPDKNQRSHKIGKKPEVRPETLVYSTKVAFAYFNIVLKLADAPLK